MLSEIEVVRQKIMNKATDEYDAVISLGGSCASCLQIRKRELQTLAYPFDYVFCVDAQYQFKILAELFKTDFKNWLRKENLVPLREDEKGISDLFQYKDKYTEYRYIHDFKRPIEEDGAFDEFYSKYMRRLNRLYEKIESSRRILFVSDAGSNLSLEDVMPFSDVLKKKWGGKVFDISILNFDSGRNEIIKKKNIKMVNVVRSKNNYDFFGMNYEWGAILDSVKISEIKEGKALTLVRKIKGFFSKDTSVRKDKVFFVTGCSRGIGRALCEILLKKGYKVVVTARNLTDIAVFREKYPSSALCLKLDVTVPIEIKDAIQTAINTFGKIDVLVNNAGVGYFSMTESIDKHVANNVFDINVFGALSVMQEVLPHMRARNSGLIINTSSIAAMQGLPVAGVYSASKAALERLSESLNGELRDFNVKLMLLEYGETASDFYRNSIVNTDVPNGYGTVADSLDNFKKGAYFSPQTCIHAAQSLLNIIECNDEFPFRVFIGNGTRSFVEKKIDSMKLELRLNASKIV